MATKDHTKTITSMGVSDKFLDSLVTMERAKEIKKQGNQLQDKIQVLVKSLKQQTEQNFDWIKIANKDLFYHTEIGALLPNLATFQLGHCNTRYSYDPKSFHNKFEGYEGRLPEREEILALFREIVVGYSITSCTEQEKIAYETDPSHKNCQFFSLSSFCCGSYQKYTIKGDILRKFGFDIMCTVDLPWWLNRLTILHETENEMPLVICTRLMSFFKDGVLEETDFDFRPVYRNFQWGIEKLSYEYDSGGNTYYDTLEEKKKSISKGFGAHRYTGKTKVLDYDSYHLPIVPMYPSKPDGIAGHLFRMIQENLIPAYLEKNGRNLFEILVKFNKVDERVLGLENGTLTVFWERLVEQTAITTLTGDSFAHEHMKKEFTKTSPISHPEAAEALVASLSSTYLHCDTLRADLEPYNIKILSDPNRGHWDLWDTKEDEKEYIIKLEEPLVGRNPEADIRYDGVIGIDFGTKSTVVVYQENSEHTMPLRVGTGQLAEKISPSDYENPTVLEFVDLKSFLTAYEEKDGRPNTLWEQVTTSHTAFDSFLSSNSDQYYSFFYELKQWSGDKQRKIHLRDKQKLDILLQPYPQLGQGDFDPIEIYAYYLGLYINNMHNGIYLRYLLSYPVTYEKEVRDRILASFERGLKKSLPISLLENPKVMKRFSVNLGASEPVSYAICALEEYGFEPDVGEEIFYAVFDFGGGTSDFDFGLYRGVDEDDYDFVVDSFGSAGDQYLGGENLLELLAFEVFKKNQDLLREKSITFEKPTECKRFAGDEILVADSQEAKINTAQLKEKLRPLWERQQGYESEFENGILKVDLFRSTGENILALELAVSGEELEQILRERIEQGVSNFFQSLVRAFNLPKNTNTIEKIHILLAGNSSKSSILREVLEVYMDEFSALIHGNSTTEKEYFVVFPPLGTEEADKFLESQGMSPKPRSIESPTCKTGVAFGLINSRQGSRIQLIRETAITEEVKFPYFLGKERRKKFRFVTEPSLEYGVWVQFKVANEENFTFFYTKSPTAMTGDMAISDVGRKLCYLEEVFPEGFVYIRAISPHEVEYVVATEEGISKEDYLAEPVSVVLAEG